MYEDTLRDVGLLSQQRRLRGPLGAYIEDRVRVFFKVLRKKMMRGNRHKLLQINSDWIKQEK